MKFCLFILIIFSGKLFARYTPQDSACIPVVIIAESKKDSCAGTAATFSAAVKNDGSNGIYKWKKNNSAGIAGNAVYTTSDLHDSDVVVCEYSCKTACGTDTTVVSNPVVIRVLNEVEPTVTVANYDPLICEGELTVFVASAYYGNEVPSYQWKVNGDSVGTNSSTFSTYTLTNGSKIECILTVSTPSCPGTSKSSSSQLTIYVYPLIHPAITIRPSKTPICRGETVTFTATANGGAFPSFGWFVNGQSTGANAPSLVTSTLKDGDTISCVVTIDQDSRCHTSTSAPSNYIVMPVRDYADPTISIASPLTDVCAGTDISFNATAQNTGAYSFYQWLVNGYGAGINSPNFVYNQFADGDSVSCILTTSIPGCSFSASVSSNSKAVTIYDAPLITFVPPEISVLSGEPAQLHALVEGSVASFIWTPEAALLTPQSLNTSTIPLSYDTLFKLKVANTSGCVASKEIVVKVLHKLYMPSAFTPNNDGKNDVFRIPPGASITLHTFSVFNRWGEVVFNTKNIDEGWNGTYQGQNLDTGTYVYLIKGIVNDKEVNLKGTVILIK